MIKIVSSVSKIQLDNNIYDHILNYIPYFSFKVSKVYLNVIPTNNPKSSKKSA